MADNNTSVENSVKLVGFYAENDDYFEFSNFGGKGHYANKYGDRGEYSEITYQASKLWHVPDDAVRGELQQHYFIEVKTPQQAFTFTRKPLPLLKNKSVNEIIRNNNWDMPDSLGVANKDREMAYCLIDKFAPDKSPLLSARLVFVVFAAEVILVEESPNDSYWGCAADHQGNPGRNRLGLLLTALARVLRQGLLSGLPVDNKTEIVIREYVKLIKQFNGFDFCAREQVSPYCEESGK